MWPWKKNKPGTTKTHNKYVMIEYGYSFDKRKVEFEGANNSLMRVNNYSKDFFLMPSKDGVVGTLKLGSASSHYVWYPLSGWTNAELRELGFAVPDDGIVPQEVQLARAVLAGDKAAAAALADWVTENWGSK